MHRCPAEGPAPRTLRSAIDDEEGLDREATVTIGTEPVCGQLGELRAEFGSGVLHAVAVGLGQNGDLLVWGNVLEMQPYVHS